MIKILLGNDDNSYHKDLHIPLVSACKNGYKTVFLAQIIYFTLNEKFILYESKIPILFS